MKVHTKKRLVNALIYGIMILVSVTMLFPFVWMLSTSFKDRMHAQIFPPQWIPDPFVWEAYEEVWEVAPLLSGIKNSLIIALPVLLLGTLSSALAAFAFAKMNIPHKNGLFMALLSSMMIPGVVTMIPQYVVWGNLELVDTFIPLILPGTLGHVTMMFFFRQYLAGVPNELIDAAKIDGAGWLTVFGRIMLPAMVLRMRSKSLAGPDTLSTAHTIRSHPYISQYLPASPLKTVSLSFPAKSTSLWA